MLIIMVLSILIFSLDISLYQRKDGRRVWAGLYSLAIHTFILVISTEILSFFHGISYFSIVLLWSVIDLAGILIGVILIKKEKIVLTDLKHLFLFYLSEVHPILVVVGMICTIAIYLSYRTIPYNWDSMTYHLTRIVHWAQNGSIAHYACHDISQISGPPLAEFVNLHVYILSGNTDLYVNLLQAFSYAVSVVLVYKISKKIGCNRLFASLAALIFSTSPIVFGEALSTQVDIYSGLWLLIFVYVTLDFTAPNCRIYWNQETLFKLLLMGVSVGFCYLAKPSVFIGVMVFVLWIFAMCLLRKDEIRTIIKAACTVILTAFFVILPELARNLITFHSISSEETSTGFLVHSWDIRYLLSNLVQNIGFNLPGRYFNIGEYVDKIIFKISYILYGGQELPSSLREFTLSDPTNMSHDRAISSTLIWLFILAILFGGIVALKKIRKKDQWDRMYSLGYVLSSMMSWIIFCTVVRWYMFITRYEIGYLALLAPAVMWVFQYIFKSRKELVYAFAGILCFISISTLGELIDYHKKFLETNENRIEGYFAVRDLYDDYTRIAEYITEKGYGQIGFICGSDSYEYPLWKMLENRINRFEHVCVENETVIYDRGDFLPDCIIIVDVNTDKTMEYRDIEYIMSLDAHGVKIYEKAIG